jgi:hypothetical protein
MSNHMKYVLDRRDRRQIFVPTGGKIWACRLKELTADVTPYINEWARCNDTPTHMYRDNGYVYEWGGGVVHEGTIADMPAFIIGRTVKNSETNTRWILLPMQR